MRIVRCLFAQLPQEAVLIASYTPAKADKHSIKLPLKKAMLLSRRLGSEVSAFVVTPWAQHVLGRDNNYAQPLTSAIFCVKPWPRPPVCTSLSGP